MLTRRDFLAYFGGMTVASGAVCALPDVLGSRGWRSAAYPEDTDNPGGHWCATQRLRSR